MPPFPPHHHPAPDAAPTVGDAPAFTTAAPAADGESAEDDDAPEGDEPETGDEEGEDYEVRGEERGKVVGRLFFSLSPHKLTTTPHTRTHTRHQEAGDDDDAGSEDPEGSEVSGCWLGA